MREHVLVMLPEELKHILPKDMWKWINVPLLLLKALCGVPTAVDCFAMNKLPFSLSKDSGKEKQLPYDKNSSHVVLVCAHCYAWIISSLVPVTLRKDPNLLQLCQRGSVLKFILTPTGVCKLKSKEIKMGTKFWIKSAIQSLWSGGAHQMQQ